MGIQLEAVTGFLVWLALVLICASSALDGPIYLLGLGPLVGWRGFEFARHVGDETTKKFRHLFIASILTFPTAFMAFLNTLEVDNWILLVSIVFLLADGAVGLGSATRISD
jgi:ABC-type enterochelin transport system permease subunit